MKILFIHPDLGIGGAERLVVDAAMALQQDDHEVHILTNHHDQSHCFTETVQDLSVDVVGEWFPRSFLGRFNAFCAYVRICLIVLYLAIFRPLDFQEPDVIFVDQISAPLCLLWLFNRRISPKGCKIVFYCHFPDLLLTKRESTLKQLYRKPIDWLEEYSMRFADQVLVNSLFTSEVFRRTFTSLSNLPLKVVYPACNLAKIDELVLESQQLSPVIDPNVRDDQIVFLSLNRYEPKKNVALAIHALHELKKLQVFGVPEAQLWIAGGYDERVNENVTYYQELVELVEKLELQQQVQFFKSPADAMKMQLLLKSDCVLYTPENEHFGIVPIEAMYMSKPVIACNSGGPLETVKHEYSGFHCEPTPSSFASAMSRIQRDTELGKRLGKQGRESVINQFSFNSFKAELREVLPKKKE